MAGGQAKVLAIDALHRFASDLRLFRDAFDEGLLLTDHDMQADLDAIYHEALRRRKAMEYYGTVVHQDSRYQSRLQEAELSYREAEACWQAAYNSVLEFRKYKTQFDSVWLQRSETACNYLNTLHIILENYTQVAVPQSTATAPSSSGTLVGNPAIDATYYAEQTGETCSVMSQWQIIRKLTGEEISAQDLIDEAVQKRILWAEGTYLPDIGKLCASHGLKTQQAYYEDMKDLRTALTDGKEVIAQVQAGILWGNNRNGGHSVWVTGMDDQYVYINDTGNTDIGAGGKIPIDRFNRAWQAFGGNIVMCSLP